MLRIVDRDAAALRELYLAYRPRLVRFLSRSLQRADVIDEVVNDVMFVVWRDAERYSGTSRVSTWIFGIAYHMALNAARRLAVDGARHAADSELANHIAEYADPAEGLADSREFEGALAQLSTEQRLMMELTFVQGYTYQEIAELTQCPVNTVKTRMFHARKRLVAWLGAESLPMARREEEQTR